MMRFESQQYIYLLALIPLLVLMYLIIQKMNTKKIEKFFKKELYFNLTKNISFTKRKLKFALEMLVLLCILLSLARPQMGESTEKVKMEGVELVIALDVSNSMLAEDLKPSRLAVAKNTINRLLDRISGYKVGLVAFAGSAAVISPLTTDYSAIRTFLETINTDTISTQGTNVRAAMQAANEAFQRGGTESDEFSKVTKVVIVISDGEDHEAGAITEADNLVKKGVRIFAMGAGTEQGAPVPMRDNFGQLQGYKKDKSHATVMSKVNTGFLRKLAASGKGAYFHVTFSGDEIRDLEKELDRLEKSEFESDFMRKYNERFQIPLMLAFLLLIIELLLSDLKFQGRPKNS